MTTIPVQHERRAAQRFEFNLPVRVRTNEREYSGCTQDISGRGVFLLLENALVEGSTVELLFCMPAEITLAEAMRVRCGGRVLRVHGAADSGKFGTAVCLESYQYLAAEEVGSNPAFDRISHLHQQHEIAPAPKNPAGD